MCRASPNRNAKSVQWRGSLTHPLERASRSDVRAELARRGISVNAARKFFAGATTRPPAATGVKWAHWESNPEPAD